MGSRAYHREWGHRPPGRSGYEAVPKTDTASH